jgi:hypothetical protein
VQAIEVNVFEAAFAAFKDILWCPLYADVVQLESCDATSVKPQSQCLDIKVCICLPFHSFLFLLKPREIRQASSVRV